MRARLSLSVVITTRNSANTIGRCLNSLMPYMRDGYISEVVVVDGYSTDRTVEIVRSYPVRLLFEEGIESYEGSIIRSHYSKYNALNIGLQNSCGDLVMFLDSDAYLGDGFFPRVTDFFDDERLGILGCWAKAHITNGISKTIGEAWQFHGKRIEALQSSSPRLLENLYRYVAWFGNKRVLTSGPCYIARRVCLEVVRGHDILGDVGLCPYILEAGWNLTGGQKRQYIICLLEVCASYGANAMLRAWMAPSDLARAGDIVFRYQCESLVLSRLGYFSLPVSVIFVI